MPLLIALDIDGTILDYDEHLSDRVRVAIQKVCAAGHEIILATGRDVLATLPVLDRLGITQGHAVCSNGAVTLRLDPEMPDGFSVIAQETFEPFPVISRILKFLPNGACALEKVGRGYWVFGPFPEHELVGAFDRVSLEQIRELRTTRVIVRSLEHDNSEFIEAVSSMGLHGVNYAVGWSAWLDIAPIGCSKATALEQVRLALDIPPADTLAVGDGRNDLEMFDWASHSVAMGNADEPVLAAADEITAPVFEDGLALVLERIVDGSGPL